MNMTPNRKRRLIRLGVLCLLAVTLVFTGTVLASYFRRTESQELVTAREFRFESDYLTEEGGTYLVPGDQVTFTLSNTDGLTTAEDEVKYTITAPGGTLDTNSGTLTGDYGTHTITLSGSGEVTVTAVSTSPYAKTLKATFNFSQPQGHYTVKDYERYVQVDVYTGNAINGGITFTMDGLTPDNTNDMLNSDGKTEPLAADSHYTFVFFKSTARDFQNVGNGALGTNITLN